MSAAGADLVAAGLVGLACLAIFAGAELLRRVFSPDPEIPRKAAHLGTGLIAAAFPWIFHGPWVPSALCVGLALLMEVTRRAGALPAIHSVKRASRGGVLYPLSLAALTHVALDRPWLWVPPVLVLSISDALAAVVGRSYGQHRYQVERGTKSIEGSLVFLLTAFLCVHVPLLVLSPAGRLESVLAAAIVALLVTGFEALSARGTDNVLVPCGTCALVAHLVPLTAGQLAAHLGVILALGAGVAALSRLSWNLTTSAALAAGLSGYAAWLFGDAACVVPVVLSFGGFCALWALRDPTREVYHLPQVCQVFGVPLALLALARWCGDCDSVRLPFLGAVGAAFSVMLYVRSVLTRRPADRGAKLERAAWAAGVSTLVLVFPALAASGLLSPVPLAGLGLVLLAVTLLYVLVHEVRGASPRFFGRLCALTAVAAGFSAALAEVMR
jgi:phytol kinase